MGLLRFSPGTCRKNCACTHCSGAGTPTTWTANILGTDYVLTRINALGGILLNPNSCTWQHYVSGSIDCSPADVVRLSIQGSSLGMVRLVLEIRKELPSNTIVRKWQSGEFAIGTVNCVGSHVLADATPGGALCPPGADTATITPGAIRTPCCDCEPATSSGSSAGPGDCPQCCDPGAPGPGDQWEVDIGASPVWTDRDCSACDQVKGTFILDFLAVRSVGLCTWEYYNLSWCADVGICAPHSIGLRMQLNLSKWTVGFSTHLCRVQVGIWLDRSGDDHPCAAFCSQWYQSADFPFGEGGCDAGITLHKSGANGCTSRSFGNPLCHDWHSGVNGPATIVAKALP